MHGPSEAARSRVSACRHTTHASGPGHVTCHIARHVWAETLGGQTGLGVARGRVRAQGGLSHNTNTRDIEFGPALMTLVLDNEIDCFSDLSNLVWQSVCIIQPDWMWKLISSKLMRSDKLVVNKFSRCTTVYQCFHCQWTVAVDCMDLDRDIGGPPKYLVSKGL